MVVLKIVVWTLYVITIIANFYSWRKWKRATDKLPKVVSKNSQYMVIRPCLWFATETKVSYSKLLEYYSPKSILELEKYGYIQEVYGLEEFIVEGTRPQ
jgi:hypothetical protein